MRKNITTALEIVGAIMISMGSFQIWQPLGWIVAGSLLVTAGVFAA